MYKFLFIMDPLENIIPTKDTTYILMLEAESRGNEIFFALQDDNIVHTLLLNRHHQGFHV